MLIDEYYVFTHKLNNYETLCYGIVSIVLPALSRVKFEW